MSTKTKPKLKPNTSTNTRANTKPKMSVTTSVNTNIGSAFDDLLKDEGTYEATKGLAIKRVRAWQMKARRRKD